MILTSRPDRLGGAYAQDVWGALAARFPGEVELHRIPSADPQDRILRGEADVAVLPVQHLPTTLPEGFALAAILPRHAFTDALVSSLGMADLPRGATVGVSNLRRRAMIHRARGDLEVRDAPGDLDDRLQLWRAGGCHGLVVATAALRRLAVDAPYEELDPKVFVPSAGQGTVGCVCKVGSPFEEFLAGIDDARTRVETELERAVVRALRGGRAPFGVHASKRGDKLEVHAVLVSVDGKRAVTLKETVSANDPMYEADELAEKLRSMGGDVLLDEARKVLG